MNVGSTAAEVIERANCPVLVIPNGTPLKSLKQLVLATDLKGELPEQANLVVELATLFDAKISFLHVLMELTDQTRTQTREGFNQICKKLSYANVSFH